MAKQGEHGIVWTDETWNPTRGCSRGDRIVSRDIGARLLQALAEAQARIDELVSERERDAAPAEPSTAEEYETLTEAPATYEALLRGADAIDARRKGGA